MTHYAHNGIIDEVKNAIKIPCREIHNKDNVEKNRVYLGTSEQKRIKTNNCIEVLFVISPN